MHCPNPSCYESPERPHLLISERSGIEIDYCPKCRGVWLDRGELDKLIERAQEEAAPAPTQQPQREPTRDYRPQQEHHYKEQQHHDSHRKHYDDDRKHHNYGGHYGKPYKKKSILSEIFDF